MAARAASQRDEAASGGTSIRPRQAVGIWRGHIQTATAVLSSARADLASADTASAIAYPCDLAIIR